MIPDLEDNGPKTQIYFNIGSGRPGQSVAVEALPDGNFSINAVTTVRNEQFGKWIAHDGTEYTDNPLRVGPGFSATLTAHFEASTTGSPGSNRADWWPGGLIGLHGRNDYTWHEADFNMIEAAQIEGVSFMGHTDTQSFSTFSQRYPNVPIITRLYDVNLQNAYFNQGKRPEAERYAEVMSNYIRNLSPYCQIFRIHNEPNHVNKYEGWSPSQTDAEDFAEWYRRVLNSFRASFPDYKFIFPNLAQGDIHGDLNWINVCAGAIDMSDAYSTSNYWQNIPPNTGDHLSDEFGLRFLKYEEILLGYGVDKPLYIAESGNSAHHSNVTVSEDDIARQIVEHYQHIRQNYPKVFCVMPFLMASPGDWQPFTWRDEDGRYKAVVSAVRNMTRS